MTLLVIPNRATPGHSYEKVYAEVLTARKSNLWMIIILYWMIRKIIQYDVIAKNQLGKQSIVLSVVRIKHYQTVP
jgi:hypothetical protein